MNDEMYDKLNDTEKYHWWFRAKREIVLELAKPYLGNTNIEKPNIADFGCGTGLLLKELQNYGNAVGYDFSDKALEYCSGKKVLETHKLDLGIINETINCKYDLAFALDIVEHIKDDSVAIRNIYNSLVDGGIAIFTVPALQQLWSQNDVNNMHYRRYNRSQIVALLQNEGFKVEYVSYYNFWLFIPAAVIRYITKWLKIDQHSSIEYNSGNGIFNRLLYRIFITEKEQISKHKGFPFGLSLIILVSKKNRKASIRNGKIAGR